MKLALFMHNMISVGRIDECKSCLFEETVRAVNNGGYPTVMKMKGNSTGCLEKT